MCDSGRQRGGARGWAGAGTAWSDPEDLVACPPLGTFSTQSQQLLFPYPTIFLVALRFPSTKALPATDSALLFACSPHSVSYSSPTHILSLVLRRASAPSLGLWNSAPMAGNTCQDLLCKYSQMPQHKPTHSSGPQLVQGRHMPPKSQLWHLGQANELAPLQTRVLEISVECRLSGGGGIPIFLESKQEDSFFLFKRRAYSMNSLHSSHTTF